MSKTDNIYIKKARKKRLIKRIIVSLIFLGIISCIVVFKTDIFIINSVEYKGDIVVTGDYVKNKSKSLYGENIFSFDKDEIISKLKKNPYVKDVVINRKLPKKLILNITEAKGLFFINEENNKAIISSDLILLEKNNEKDTDNLIEIKGLDTSSIKIGDKISADTRLDSILNELYDEQGIIKKNKEEFRIVSVDLSDLSNIKVYLNNIEVRIGTDENLRKKMSNAITVYKVGLSQEYIDVSFNGTPDFK